MLLHRRLKVSASIVLQLKLRDALEARLHLRDRVRLGSGATTNVRELDGELLVDDPRRLHRLLREGIARGDLADGRADGDVAEAYHTSSV